MTRLLIIGGATGSGKSKVAVACAEKLNGEIISADSMQIYRGFDIGTAKITADEMHGIPHYMIDICDPNDTFTVADFKKKATEYVLDIINRGKTPIVCGGTGMYIHSLLYDMSYSGAFDPELRKQLNEELLLCGKEYMHDKLASLDPSAAQRLHVNDTKRVVRAIEKHLTGGGAENDYEKPLFPYKMFLLDRDRETLYDRINKRVDKMLRDGLLSEVSRLRSEGVRPDAQAMQAIAYKEWDMGLSEAETIELIKKNTRNYAKRQNTWFKQYKDAVHLDAQNTAMDEIVQTIINNYSGECDER